MGGTCVDGGWHRSGAASKGAARAPAAGAAVPAHAFVPMARHVGSRVSVTRPRSCSTVARVRATLRTVRRRRSSASDPRRGNVKCPRATPREEEKVRTSIDIDGLLLDMDGVLTISWEPLPGAAAALATLRAAGLPLRLLTSTTALSRAELAALLRRLGLRFSDDEVLAAAVLAAEHLRAHRPGARVCLLGDARREDLEGVDLVGLDEAPELILLSGADQSFRFETFNSVLRAVLAGAELMAMHRTDVWMTREGPCLDTGAYLTGLERATGCEALVSGKPAPACFAAGAASLGLPARRVAMVGDDVENDVLAAQAAGLRGVLVRTGKFRETALAAASGVPHAVVDSIADLPALLGL